MWVKAKQLMGLLPDRLVNGVCTCGPVGYWGRAPGTNGTAVGLALYTVVFFHLGLVWQIILAAVLTALAILFCDEGERRLQKRDPGEVIIDEIVAVPVCLIGFNSQMAATGHVWAYMLAVFFIFRFFDILKPLGINSLQRYPGGIGVVLDDIGAALATNITLRVFLLLFALGGW